MSKSAPTSAATPAGLSGLDGYPHVWAGAFPTTSIEIDKAAAPGVGAYAAALAELALTVKREGSQSDERAWTVIAEAAAAIIPGAQQAAVVTLAAGASGLEMRAAYGDLPGQLVEAETETGQGPCTDVLSHTVTVRSTDVGHEQRWPLFIQRAVDSSVRSMLCTPLVVQSQMFGCLTLTGTVADAFDENTEVLAAVFAGHAAVALLGLAESRHLRAMAASRDIIGQAKGILMALNKLTADEAFAVLVRTSQHSNRKLRDICVDFISTGNLHQS